MTTGKKAQLLLVRPPARSLAQGLVSHIADRRDSIQYDTAVGQWKAYTDVFRQHGWQVIQVERDDTLPDSVFVEDGVVSVNDLQDETRPALLIIASPGNSARQAEPAGIRRALEEHLPHHTCRSIERPGTLDGGDVLKVPAIKTIYVGQSARTNEQGLRQFRALTEPLGWKVVGVPVVKALHLKSMLTALPDGTIIGDESLVEDVKVFERFIAMPEPEGVAVVHLAVDLNAGAPLIMSASAPRSLKLLQDLGYKVTTADVTEFEKLEGCVTCLSVRIRS